MAMSNAERLRKWLMENRDAFNLRRRNARKGSSLVEKEAKREATVLRTEMPSQKISGQRIERVEVQRDQTACTVPVVSNGGAAKAGYNPPPRPSVAELREMMAKASEKPASEPPEITDTRSAKDVVGGIYRNDNGGVISKFAWEKLQKMKAHAKENNFEIDDYSQ